MVSGNQKIVRIVNRARILNLIREHQPVSRVRLAAFSGLNKSTVSSIVSDLLIEKLIQETVKDASTGGRKPILLSLDGREHKIGAIDFDPENSYVAVGDMEAHIIKKKIIKTKYRDPSDFIKRCLRMLFEIKDELKCSNLKSIGISIPGIVDTNKSEVLIAPDLEWKNLDIGQLVQEVAPDGTFGKVIIENEANASALAEQWFGNHVTQKSNIVFVSEGIGTGIILNNKLVQGSFDAAGQFGHMTINPDGELCICGNRGCWETYTSNSSTVQRYCGQNFNGRTNTELKKIIQLARNGDSSALHAIRETGRYLGIGISNIMKAIDPEVVVLGGLITGAWNIIYPEISREIEKRVFFGIEMKRNIDIIPTSLPERSSLIGAITLVIREIFGGYRIAQ
ncbi:MAG: ROK family protein [bacterium]